MKSKLLILLSIGFIWLVSCISIENKFSKLPPGEWRGVLKLDRSNWDKARVAGRDVEPIVDMKETSLGELPFNFEVIYITRDSFTIAIRNSDEIIYPDRIDFGLDRATAKDTVVLYFDTYDSYIKAIFEERVMQGEFVVNTRDNYQIPFVAYYGKNYRFSDLKKTPVTDISGKWKVSFADETDKSFPAIGEFEQQGNTLKGTFLTETGDYRYLEGNILANKIYLSAFDGGHVLLFEGKILEDSSIIGSFWSGLNYKVSWKAIRDENAQLADPLNKTQLLPGFDKFDFTFKNTSGKDVSLNDSIFKGKAKVIQITGSWCPNCKDETKFLTEYLSEYAPEDLAVIALSFEKYTDTLRAYQAIDKFSSKFSAEYPFLYAGRNNAESVKAALPMLNGIFSYPTTIYLNKNNEVVKIFTGFSGPATSQYGQFKKDFHQTVLEITK